MQPPRVCSIVTSTWQYIPPRCRTLSYWDDVFDTFFPANPSFGNGFFLLVPTAFILFIIFGLLYLVHGLAYLVSLAL